MDLLKNRWKYIEHSGKKPPRFATTKMGIIVDSKLNELMIPCFLHERIGRHVVKAHNDFIKNNKAND